MLGKDIYIYLVRHHISHGSLDEPWQYHINSDPELAELLGRGLGEANDPGLAGGVVCLADVASPGHYTGNVHYGPRQLLLLH